MSIIIEPSNVKFMTKEARRLSNGIYSFVSKYQSEMVFDIYFLETAVSRCMLATYLSIAKAWVKVPKKKPKEEWLESIRDFSNHFEMSQQPTKQPLSLLHKNRDDEIIWTDKLREIYIWTSNNMLQDWSSYEEMKIMINWSNEYTISQLNEALLISQHNNAISIQYIDGILRKQKLLDGFRLSTEKKQVSGYVAMPIYKEPLTKDEIDELYEVRRKAIDDARQIKEEIYLSQVFKDME